jgi:hypothetical protein
VNVEVGTTTGVDVEVGTTTGVLVSATAETVGSNFVSDIEALVRGTLASMVDSISTSGWLVEHAATINTEIINHNKLLLCILQ